MIMIQDSNSWYEDMITDNGVCHITEDIILTDNIVLGNNTTLLFEGGIIKGNYTLTGKNTRIISSAFTQLFSEVLLAGSWKHTYCYAEWWRDEEDEDDTNSINLALASTIESVKLQNINYQISDSLVISSHKALIGTRNAIEDSVTQITASGCSSYSNIITLHSSFVSIKDISIISADNTLNGIYTDDGPEESDDCYRLLIERVSVSNCDIGFFFHTYLTVIRGCEAKYVNYGFMFSRGTSVSMSDCIVKSYKINAYHIDQLCYSTFTRCIANNLLNISEEVQPDFAFVLQWPHSISLVECNCNNVEKGIYNDGGSNIKIVDCSIDMSKMQNTLPKGRVLQFNNVRYCNVQRFHIFKSEDSDWSPNDNEWRNCLGIIYIKSSNNAFKTILLNEVVATTHSNPPTFLSLFASHINTYVEESKVASIFTVERNWAKSGPASMRPNYPDVTDITGLGWTFFNTNTNSVEVWTGNSWLSID